MPPETTSPLLADNGKRGDATARAIPVPPALLPAPEFGLVSFEALTAFFAFEVTARAGAIAWASERFVVNVIS